MRLFEIEAKPLVPVQSARFRKHFEHFAQAFPELRDRLAEFVAFKTTHPTEPHSRKDTGFHNDRLRGYRHEHLILGKVIIIYEIANGQLRLCDCVEHKAFEGAAKALIAYVGGLSPGSFDALPASERVQPLSSQQKRDLIALIYELTQEEPELLRKAQAGSWHGFMEWATVLVEATPEAIFASFNGKAGLANEIANAFAHLSA